MSRKTMSIEEFRELGLLQEVNRQVLHPLGLAMAASVPSEPAWTITFGEDGIERLRVLVQWGKDSSEKPDGIADEDWDILLARIDEATETKEVLGPVFDDRDDPEGIYFEELTEEEIARAKRLQEILDERAPAREKALGYVVQPLR